MIIRKDDLDSAVEHGVISARDAQALTDFTIKRAETPRAMNEQFHLVNNFSEVFICIGLFIIYSAFGGIITTGMLDIQFTPIGVIGFWLLAEFFTYRTNKKLPALVSVLMACVLAVKSAMLYAGIGATDMWAFDQPLSAYIWGGIALALIVSFARFKIPLLLALIAASTTIAAVIYSKTTVSDASFLWPLGICGVTILALAFWFDSRDPLRRSRQNAYAFWLFIIGSPLAIHPVFASVWLNSDGSQPGTVIGIVFALAVIVSLLGLILDRRSLVASSLIYFTVGIGYSYYSITNDASSALATTSLLVGFFVVLLGVLWYRARSIIMLALPFKGLKALVPPSR